MWVRRREGFHLDGGLGRVSGWPRSSRGWEEDSTHGLLIEGPNKGVSVAIFSCGDGGFGLDDRVDTANCDGTSVPVSSVRHRDPALSPP